MLEFSEKWFYLILFFLNLFWESKFKLKIENFSKTCYLNFKLSKTLLPCSLIFINPAKFDAISFSEAYNTDVICLTETHLHENSDVSYLRLDGYHPIVRRDRIGQFGGGVAIFVASHLCFNLINLHTDPNSLELLWGELTFGSYKIKLGVCYRPPAARVSFWDDLHESIGKIRAQAVGNPHIILCADLNADFGTFEGSKLETFAKSNMLCIHVSQPTRLTEYSASCLDQFLSNMPDMVETIKIFAPVSTNDHSTVVLHLKHVIQRNYSYKRHVWMYNNANFDAFRTALQKAEWDLCFDNSVNIDDICDKWSNTFMKIAYQCIPNRNITVRLRDKPWYNNDLRQLKRAKNRIHNKAKFSNNPHIWKKFREARNKYCNLLKQAKHEYFSSLCNHMEHQSNSSAKKFWHMAKAFMGRDGDCCLPSLLSDDKLIIDNELKANHFNHYFAKKSRLDEAGATLPPPSHNNTPSLSEFHISEKDVFDSICNLHPNKAAGPDGIGPRMIKEAGVAIAPSLARLFNFSIESGKFPCQWKRANVIPVHKKGPRQDVSNYRPVSLLCIIGKCFEKIVSNICTISCMITCY